MNTSLSMLGALSALGSALMWAISAVLFRRLGDHMGAAAMNLGKGLVALICLLVILVITGFQTLPGATILALGASGLLGIAIGDTLYFLTLVRLGPRLTLL
ncbi:MAG: EamA family transporter, partial [Nitrospira sp.]|nr:EamA family transporter [Nitrospira sp.]